MVTTYESENLMTVEQLREAMATYRRDHELSYDQLQDKWGVAASTLHRLEHGKGGLRHITVVRLTRILAGEQVHHSRAHFPSCDCGESLFVNGKWCFGLLHFEEGYCPQCGQELVAGGTVQRTDQLVHDLLDDIMAAGADRERVRELVKDIKNILKLW